MSKRLSSEVTADTIAALLDLAAVAEWLGGAECFMRRLVDERRIPFLKIGKSVRCDPTDVVAWIDEAAEKIRGFENELADTNRLAEQRLQLENRLGDVDAHLAEDRRICTRQLRRDPPFRITITITIDQRTTEAERIRA